VLARSQKMRYHPDSLWKFDEDHQQA
jgi:hypothetical protein